MDSKTRKKWKVIVENDDNVYEAFKDVSPEIIKGMVKKLEARKEGLGEENRRND